MKTVLLLGGPAAGQRAEVHGNMTSVVRTHPDGPLLYRIVPMCSHGEVHWFGVLDGADPLALLIAGYGGGNAALMQTLVEQAAFGDGPASYHLESTGSFAWFDEPDAVQQARAALNALGFKPC